MSAATAARVDQRPCVAIAGGGVAALEAALRLRRVAGERPRIVVAAPNDELVVLPETVTEPFGWRAALRLPWRAIADELDLELRKGAVELVDLERRRLLLADDGGEVTYDGLLVATGARRVRPYEHATVFDPLRTDTGFAGLVRDLEQGFCRRLAVLVPPGPGWPLPAYELALLFAARAHEMGIDCTISLVTEEPAPLAIFGERASSAVQRLLAERGVETHFAAVAHVEEGRVFVQPEASELVCDRIVALPRLVGPALHGLPATVDGWIPIDSSCRVAGTTGHVFCAGDASAFPVKHGSIACAQADAAADCLATRLGLAHVGCHSFRAVVRAKLFTGSAPLYLEARVIAGRGFESTVADTPPWGSETKIAGEELSSFVERFTGHGR